jgi:hypothetical protein
VHGDVGRDLASQLRVLVREALKRVPAKHVHNGGDVRYRVGRPAPPVEKRRLAEHHPRRQAEVSVRAVFAGLQAVIDPSVTTYSASPGRLA